MPIVIADVENNRVQSWWSLESIEECDQYVSVHAEHYEYPIFTYDGEYDEWLWVDENQNVSIVYDLEEDKAKRRDERDMRLSFCQGWTEPYTEAQQAYLDALNGIEDQEGFPSNIVWPDWFEVAE